MNDHSFDDDLSRRLYDPSHPLYGRKAFSDVSGVSVDREEMTELGPWGTRLLYAGLALVAASSWSSEHIDHGQRLVAAGR